MAQLPEDLIFEILVQSPVKSVLRCKCLSKSLCTLINTPHFINSHSSQKHNRRKLILESQQSKFHVYDVNVDDLEREIVSLQKPVSSLSKSVCGYCKEGLVLVYVSDLGFGVWNPSTRQYKDLPVCPANSKVYVKFASGLAYDDSDNDYKVFCIIHKKHKPKWQVWIYGLKSNIWRNAYPSFPFLLDYKFFPEGIGLFSDTSMHWPIVGARHVEILAFDVRKETFSLLPQPVCRIKSKFAVLMELHVLESCVYISYSSLRNPRHAYLYMREKDGVDQFTWIELYAVTTAPEICSFPFLNLLGYSKKRDKILIHFCRCGMVWYDLKKKHFAKVEIDMNPKWSFQLLCNESLVSIGN